MFLNQRNFLHYLSVSIISVSTLNISIASACRFLWFIETELSFSNTSSKDERLSLQINRRHISCNLVILLYVLLRYIHINGQYLNWAMKKAFTANIFLLKSMNGVILDMAFNLCDAFLQMFYRCVIEMSIYCQKTSLKVFHKSCLFCFLSWCLFLR